MSKYNYQSKMFLVTEKNPELFAYFRSMAMNAKNLYNVTNYHIRQVMTEIQKEENLRQPNEVEVLSLVNTYLPLYADINGAANILRKAFPKAFPVNADRRYLTKNVQVWQIKDFYQTKQVSR